MRPQASPTLHYYITTILLLFLLLLLIAGVPVAVTASTVVIRAVTDARYQSSTCDEQLTPAATVTARSLRYDRRCRSKTDVMMVARSSPPKAMSTSQQPAVSDNSQKYVQPTEW